MTRRAIDKKWITVIKDPSKWTVKRLAWAYGCSPKGSYEESRLLSKLIMRLDELKIERRGEPLDGATWPFGPPDRHELVCPLFEGAVYCDCNASEMSDP